MSPKERNRQKNIVKSYLTTYLVLAGTILLMGGLYFTRKIIREPPSSDDRWRIMYLLILFFIIGYLVFSVAAFGEPFNFITLVVALIFCGGGGFVVTVTLLSARMGGDEFTVLLYNVSHDQATNTAESFRKKLANYCFRQMWRAL